ncbi:hypothetical protein [Terrisporobacter sp.]
MNIKNDMKNMKDDVVKGVDKVGNSVKDVAEKIGHAVEHTAKDLKEDVEGMAIDAGEIASDMKEKHHENKFAREIKRQIKKEDK